MKKNYKLNSGQHLKFQYVLSLFILFFLSGEYYTQQTYTFTNCGSTGSLGPTAAMTGTAYSATNLSGSVTINPQGVQNFTVPITGGYRIECRGAQGYGTFGGRGAIMAGDFTLTAGTVLKIIVGQAGSPPISPGTNQYGGGGGSFVTYTNNVPLVIAGGGGGSWATAFTAVTDGTTSPNGNSALNGSTNGAGGTGGNGGGSGNFGDGGGGLSGNGSGAAAGLSFVNGGTGGAQYGHGGFGGGAGASSWDNRRGCGGGGYSGGGGADGGTTLLPEGGGGGSLNNGVNPTNLSGANLGHGRVIIQELCSVKIFATGGTNSVTPAICSGQSLTLTTTAISNYTWSTGNTTNTMIVVTPVASQTYSIIGTSSLACQAIGNMSVTVNSGVPVLSISNPSPNICLGRSTTLTANGAITYTWNPSIQNGVSFTPASSAQYTVTGQNGCGISTATTGVTVAPLPVTASASPTLVCEGYPSTLTAIAAVNGYTWWPVANTGSLISVAPTANTIYTVVASDGTCSGTATLALQTKTTPTITASGSATQICQGQSVNLSASGAGTGGTYSWSPGNGIGSSISVSPASSTLYVVIGTNSLNCSAQSQQIILVDPSPVLNITATQTLVCTGSTVNLTVSGGTNYVWTSGPSTPQYVVTVNGPAVYTVTGQHTSNPCTASKTITLSAVVPAVTVSSNTAVCTGASATLSASGATSYTWNSVPGSGPTYVASPANTTTYYLVANTQSLTVNCISNHSVIVTVNPNPTVTAATVKSLTCKGEANTLTATGAVNYSWGPTGAGSSVVIHPTITTVYTVTAIDANGCEGVVIVQAKVSTCPGFVENSVEPLISLYPNPTSGDLTIKGTNDIDLRLINSIGQVIAEIKMNQSNAYTAKLESLSPGVYFLVGEQGDEKVLEKIVVTK
jgi:hypothetical protein